MTKQTKPARSARVEARPDPRSWDMDELMSLQEAVDLHWPGPEGLLSVSTLRTAIRQGRIAVCEIAGKHFLTRRILLDLSKGRILASAPDAPPTVPQPEPPRRGARMTEAEARAFVGLPPCKIRTAGSGAKT
jgi:hypothetical protein